jgi:DNA invertase Pin-like site-specific DNA recombinase
MKRAALYLRVSTDKQTVENQKLQLRQVAERRGWTIAEDAIYTDAGISGAKGRKDRPGLDQMLKDAQRGRFDVVMAWAIDRMGRSLIDLLGTIEHLKATGVDLYLDQQNIDTTTPMGKLIFQVTGAFAEFERNMIQQRIHAGIARARKHGTKSGAPIGRAPIDPKLAARAREALAKGMSYRAAAKVAGVSLGTVQRIAAASRPFGESAELDAA